MNLLSGRHNSELKLIANKYRNAQTYVQGSDGNEYYTLIDKVDPDYKKPQNAKEHYSDKVGYFLTQNFVEDERATRSPVVVDADAEYESISPDEQTFSQPINNPIAPQNISGVEDPTSVESFESGDITSGQQSEDGENISGSSPDATGLESSGGQFDPTGQDSGVSGVAPASPEMASQVGGRDPGGLGISGEDIGLGEDVNQEMAPEAADPLMRSIQTLPDFQRACHVLV